MSRTEIMKSYIPSEIAESELFKAILEANGEELGQLRTNINDVLKQFYVETATDWGLDLWEQMLNLKSYAGNSLEQRQSRIISKLRGMGKVTVNLIKNVAESYVYGTVEVTENPEEYSFTIKFISQYGIPANLDDVKAAIEEIKPAHLAVVYEFRYLIWNELDALELTWDELDTKNLTWDEFEVGGWLNA